jgi:hypothetical protein
MACNEFPNGCRMQWNYWGTGHGKGPHDGAGACLKQSLRKEQVKPDAIKLHNAADVVAYLKDSMNMPNAAYPKARRLVNRHFIEIGQNEVLRTDPLDCKTVPGSRSMHSIRSISRWNNTLLECRDFSCFCDHCLDGVPGVCPHKPHASPWKLITLEPIKSTDIVQESEEEEVDLEWTAELDDNFLASQLQVGDNFAVPVEPGNAEGADFYIVQCTKTMHIVQDVSRKDAWSGKLVEKGDEIVEGLYYRRQGRKENSYVLLRDEAVSFHYSHLILRSKVSMKQAPHKQKGGTSVYQLSEHALQSILDVIKSKRQLEELQSGSESEGTDSSGESEFLESDESDREDL